MLIDKNEIRQRFLRSRDTYNEQASIQHLAALQVNKLITEHLDYPPKNILEVGCGTGLLTGELARSFGNCKLYVNDIVDEICCSTADKFGIPLSQRVNGDIEQIDLPHVFDLIVSASTFQWFTQLGKTIEKFAKHLKGEGLLIFSTYGKYNLREIRLTTGGGLDYLNQEEIMEMLEPCFKVEKTLEEFHLLEFADPFEILLHLKKTGVNVSGDRTVWTKSRVKDFMDEYNARFAMDGRVTLTYHPLYFVCRKKNY